MIHSIVNINKYVLFLYVVLKNELLRKHCWIIYKEIPPTVEYSLTEAGKSFISVLNAMGKWGESYLEYKKSLAKLNKI